MGCRLPLYASSVHAAAEALSNITRFVSSAKESIPHIHSTRGQRPQRHATT